MYSACRSSTVRIMIAWNTWRSMAQSLQSTSAAQEGRNQVPIKLNWIAVLDRIPLILAVLLQLYSNASSPITFPYDMLPKNISSRETST